jgi:Cu-Zn family superoxide dismutase
MKAMTRSLLCAALLFSSACDDENTTTDAGATPTTDAGQSSDGGTTDAASAADAPAGDGPAASDAGAADAFTMSSGAWVVFDLGDAGANPASNIMGSAAAYEVPGGKTRVVLSVTGLAANTTYGSHVHKLACAEMMAGGHYQDKPAAAADASVNDPAFGNVMNEIWLDFTTDAAGKGMSERTVDFKVRPGEAKSIVVHRMMTADGGVAGPKLACLNIAF